VVLATAVAVAAPQGPGYVGVFHVAAGMAARAFGASEPKALALAILMWFVNILPITLAGLGFLWREQFSLKTIVTASQELKERGAEKT